MNDGIVTIDGRTMIQVLPRCKKMKNGQPMCGFCGESTGPRLVFSSAHNATLLEHCGVVQFVHEGLVKQTKLSVT